uniref:Uncharacterized protein n=1 Tax=viral metagenome TaxID=1070528 RepID=A0A6C0EUS6_9ZZZZ
MTQEFELELEIGSRIGREEEASTKICAYTSADAREYNQQTDGREATSSFPTNIYRYKFTQSFMDELYQFSKIHQYDDRKSFKEAWLLWVETNLDMINTEIVRLTDLQYDGDIVDKMFKSARYYFRKKSTKKTEPCIRRNYVSVQKDLLDEMDGHIAANIVNDNYKPSDGFSEFCNNNVDALKKGVAHLMEQGMKDSHEIKDKIKKTYKNRYFIFITNK